MTFLYFLYVTFVFLFVYISILYTYIVYVKGEIGTPTPSLLCFWRVLVYQRPEKNEQKKVEVLISPSYIYIYIFLWVADCRSVSVSCCILSIAFPFNYIALRNLASRDRASDPLQTG